MKDIQWFIDHGCELTKPDIRIFFFGVFGLSQGKPCNGCNCKDTCPAWPLFRADVNVPSNVKPGQQVCWQCNSPLNMTKVERRGGKCACGAKV